VKVELSSRQWQALVGKARGLHYREIAEEMETTTSAVKGLLTEARNKLGAQTTSQAVYRATSWGVIPPEQCDG